MNSSKYINTNYTVEDAQLDESVGPLKDENKMRDRALGIMNNVLETLLEQENCKGYLDITNYKVKALERANNDFVTGVSLQVTIRTSNDYRCEYPNLIDCEGNTTWDTTNPCPQLEIPLPTRYSMDFNGTNQYGQISQQNNNVFDLDWRQPFTFETWYYYTPLTTAYFLNKINAGAGYFFSCVGSRDVLRFQLRNTSPFQIIDVNSVNTLTEGWNHIVMAWDGSGSAEQGVTFYINNIDSPKPNIWTQGNQLTAGTLSNSALLEIQRITAFGVYGGNKIAHQRLWNGVELNATEVNTLFNGGKVLYEDIPHVSNILFECGFGDEYESWYGTSGWLMQPLNGTASNFVFGVASDEIDRSNDVPG